MYKEECVKDEKLPRINLRPLVFCAFGLVFGIFLYSRIRFGGIAPSDFCFLLVFLLFALFPLSKKRVIFLICAVILFGGMGASGMHFYTESFLNGKQDGQYTVSGTVTSFSFSNGYAEVLLEDLTLNNVSVGGKMRAYVLSENVRSGDIISFESKVTRNGLPVSGDSYSEYLFYSDIRYEAGSVSYQKVGTSPNVFLRLSSALYDRLNADMGGAEAQIAYALLTGNSHGMDAGLLDAVRTGGIAHIFAVSGLHIGILFGAVLLLFKPLRRKAFFPAIAVAFLYAALCAFTVSSVRALIMCAVLGGYRAIGRKYDFLQSISLAAIIVLFLSPAEFLSAGMRLSFGACLGLALFSGTLSRLFGRIPRFPRFISNYFAANLSVQFFTFPILLETFGYFSVWGFLLNLFLIPLLPALFLTVLLFSVLALIIAPAGAFLLAAPKGLLALLLLIFSFGDFSFVLTGFSLGMGAVVWLIATLLLSERFRMRVSVRAGVAALLAVVFSLAVLFQNAVFAGGRISVYTRGSGCAALIRTPEVNVLIIDGDILKRHAEDFLSRNYGGTLDAVFVLSEEELDGINCAAFLDTRAIYVRDEIATGLKKTPVIFAETASLGGLTFRYETRHTLTVMGEGIVIAFDFEKSATVGADLFIDSASGGLLFSFEDGIIKAI
ncbi:MAG: ComEC/Rec2 family competence protein [Clostridia bacterium]|nr:ComEC/Rec2 family competence protein [Clostridia bacterium]